MSLFGREPKAEEAYRYHAHNLAIYPDGSAIELRNAIGEVYGLDQIALALDRVLMNCCTLSLSFTLKQATKL